MAGHCQPKQCGAPSAYPFPGAKKFAEPPGRLSWRSREESACVRTLCSLRASRVEVFGRAEQESIVLQSAAAARDLLPSWRPPPGARELRVASLCQPKRVSAPLYESEPIRLIHYLLSNISLGSLSLSLSLSLSVQPERFFTRTGRICCARLYGGTGPFGRLMAASPDAWRAVLWAKRRRQRGRENLHSD